MNMVSLNVQGLNPKAKKEWVKEICSLNKVNFLSLQETKMESIDLFDVKNCWGNFAFDYVFSLAVGNSGGILCVWEKASFKLINSTISDYFVMVRGKWVSSGISFLIISVYAPQELSEKRMLWDYLGHVIANWKGEVIVMGDFNEVRYKNERYGTLFNVQSADVFNRFILNSNLEEIPLGGCSFTWCHRSASKMSKLDRFLVSESLLSVFPNLSAITLDRYLSDHRPIMLREMSYDYGPIPFRLFHYWFEIDGFEKIVVNSWSDESVVESNPMLKLMYKLKLLKKNIRVWNGSRQSFSNKKNTLKKDLRDVEMSIDKGNMTEDILNTRKNIIKEMNELEKLHGMEVAQKAKIKWAIEGDENSKYYHGILNKKRNQLSIRGILKDGTWVDKPNLVKEEFKIHFMGRFAKPTTVRPVLNLDFPHQLNLE